MVSHGCNVLITLGDDALIASPRRSVSNPDGHTGSPVARKESFSAAIAVCFGPFDVANIHA